MRFSLPLVGEGWGERYTYPPPRPSPFVGEEGRQDQLDREKEHKGITTRVPLCSLCLCGGLLLQLLQQLLRLLGGAGLRELLDEILKPLPGLVRLAVVRQRFGELEPSASQFFLLLLV